MITSKLNMKI